MKKNKKSYYIFNKCISTGYHSKLFYTYASLHHTYASFSYLNTRPNFMYPNYYPSQSPSKIYYKTIQPTTLFISNSPILSPTNILNEPSNKYDMNTIIIISVCSCGVSFILFIILLLYKFKYSIYKKCFKNEKYRENNLHLDIGETDTPDFGVDYAADY